MKYAVNVRNQHNAIHSLFEVEDRKTVVKLDRYLKILNTLENFCTSVEDLKLVLLKHSRFLKLSKKVINNPNFNWDDEDFNKSVEYIWNQLNNSVEYKSYEINFRDIDENKSEYVYDEDEKPIIIFNYPSYTINI